VQSDFPSFFRSLSRLVEDLHRSFLSPSSLEGEVAAPSSGMRSSGGGRFLRCLRGREELARDPSVCECREDWDCEREPEWTEPAGVLFRGGVLAAGGLNLPGAGSSSSGSEGATARCAPSMGSKVRIEWSFWFSLSM